MCSNFLLFPAKVKRNRIQKNESEQQLDLNEGKTGGKCEICWVSSIVEEEAQASVFPISNSRGSTITKVPTLPKKVTKEAEIKRVDGEQAVS